MKGKGLARIRVWEGASIWLVDVEPVEGASAHVTDFHSHHAVQITLSLGGRIVLGTATRQIAGNVVVAADARHRLESRGRIAVLFVEPESQAGRAIADGLLRGEAIAELPAALTGDVDRLLRRTGADQDLEAIGRDVVARLAGVARAEHLDPRVHRMIAHAASQLHCSPVTLPSAARAAALSPSRARHLFVEQTGLAFRTYLLWLRIMKSVVHLSAGSSLTEAAHAAGFADSAHFSRTFRRMFGISAASLRIN